MNGLWKPIGSSSFHISGNFINEIIYYTLQTRGNLTCKSFFFSHIEFGLCVWSFCASVLYGCGVHIRFGQIVWWVGWGFWRYYVHGRIEKVSYHKGYGNRLYYLLFPGDGAEPFWVLVWGQTIVLIEDVMLYTYELEVVVIEKCGVGVKLYVCQILACPMVCT